jgi:Leucine rich repeat N-terminal domain
MTYHSMRVCAAGLAIAFSSFAAPAQAQVVTFTDLRDAVPGKFFDPANSQQTATTLEIAFDNNDFKASTVSGLGTTATRSAMDTISFNVHAPADQYVSSITYEQTGTGSIIRVAGASGASSWVIGGQPAQLGSFLTNPSLSQTVTFTDSQLTVVPVSITTGLFVFQPPTGTGGDATVELTSAKVTVTFATLPTDGKKAATIIVTDYSGTYDGAPHRATGNATGVNGEDLTDLLVLGESFTDAPGGTANWTFSGDADYSAAAGTATITINPADATLAVVGYSGTYDGAAHGATGTATGVNNEDLSALFNLGASFTDVGSFTASWTFGGDPNYNPASGTAAITIAKATPIISWAQPAAITAGTALTDAQLNATASVDGTFVYTPSAGTVLTGTQTLSVTFTPTDTVNYNGATATVSITVTPDTSLRVVNPGAQANTVGDSVRLALAVTGDSANDRRRGAWTASGLPPGLRMEKDGEIRGRPTTAGAYRVGVTFTRGGAAASTQFDWTILSR